MVWGILLLLGVGYGWLIQIGTGISGTSRTAGIALSILYGVGAALTLDEFALWLNLRDVYWEREGRESIHARHALRRPVVGGTLRPPVYPRFSEERVGAVVAKVVCRHGKMIYFRISASARPTEPLGVSTLSSVASVGAISLGRIDSL